jgi:hypothetical protein
MINLFDAFTAFVAIHPGMSAADRRNVAGCLKNLLDADPEKEIMRRTLEHYANEFNWPYMTDSPDGYAVLGMEAGEATNHARHALKLSQLELETCLLSMYEDHAKVEAISDVHLLVESQVA